MKVSARHGALPALSSETASVRGVGGRGVPPPGFAHLFHLGSGDAVNGLHAGPRALMLAVLEDGLRSYLSSDEWIRDEAQLWVANAEGRSPFSFARVCEVLGIEPNTVRAALERLRHEQLKPKRAIRKELSNGHRGRRLARAG